MTSDRDGETESGKAVPAGTTVQYLGHFPGAAIEVRLPDGTVDVMHPACFPVLRGSAGIRGTASTKGSAMSAVAKKAAERKCSKCKRLVTVGTDGNLCTHGPGPAGEYVCPGSGDKGMVKAGKFKA
jgi:hypothetical protein